MVSKVVFNYIVVVNVLLALRQILESQMVQKKNRFFLR